MKGSCSGARCEYPVYICLYIQCIYIIVLRGLQFDRGASPSMAVSVAEAMVRSTKGLKAVYSLQGSGCGSGIDGGHRLDVSGQRSGVDGTTGLGSVDATVSHWGHDDGGSMSSNHSGSRGSKHGRSGGVDRCRRPRSHVHGSGPVGGGNGPGRGHHSGSGNGGVGQSMSSHLGQQGDHRRLHAHGEGQGEDNGDGELYNAKDIV